MTDNEELAKLLGWERWEPITKSERGWRRASNVTGHLTYPDLPDYFNDANTRGELLDAVKDRPVAFMRQLFDSVSTLSTFGVPNAFALIALPQPQLAAAVLAVLRAEG